MIAIWKVRAQLLLSIWRRYVVVRALLLRRLPLSVVVERLKKRPSKRSIHQEPAQLGRSIVRALRLGNLQPRCLTLALIHFSLLHENQIPADLVIGLPPNAGSPRAHAWVEIRGIDIGPPPGRHGHEGMVRFS